ncbi:MAG TPA: ATP-dependent DNA ligase [Propionibacteriaceae bacterium]|nr:ATP-dependent DNA ligase [Propionibacteriaceae bacterium]
MLLAQVVDTSRTLAATRSRTAKTSALAALLRDAAGDGTRSVELVTALLSGFVPHGRLGVGYRSLSGLPAAAPDGTLTLAEVDAAFAALASASGPGAAGSRREVVGSLFSRATAAEQRFLRGLITGDVRQGALDGVMQGAIAEAAGVPAASVRRAAMLAGRLPPVAVAALSGGVDALERIGLEVFRPVAPMLAASKPSVAEALAGGGPGWSVECKYDGIRVQAHKRGDEVRVFTRSLDDITDRVPDIVAVVAPLPAHSLVLDGEAIALRADGRPQPFQVTGARTASTRDPEQLRREVPLTTILFDVLHLDGHTLLDQPLAGRRQVLERLVPQANLVPSVQTDDVVVAQDFNARMLAAGHEGVVIKDLAGVYSAGRRGGSWVKVKPRHTLDLVVLAVERGSGRRHGLLSNIHLGARDTDSPGGWVMLGKTFKGMTDEMLAWQTRRFRDLAVADDGWTVTVRPEQVVEVAFDGVQRSSRYPGGLALRFARVLRYRDDKRAEDADTLETVRALWPLPGSDGGGDVAEEQDDEQDAEHPPADDERGE